MRKDGEQPLGRHGHRWQQCIRSIYSVLELAQRQTALCAVVSSQSALSQRSSALPRGRRGVVTATLSLAQPPKLGVSARERAGRLQTPPAPVTTPVSELETALGLWGNLRVDNELLVRCGQWGTSNGERCDWRAPWYTALGWASFNSSNRNRNTGSSGRTAAGAASWNFRWTRRRYSAPLQPYDAEPVFLRRFLPIHRRRSLLLRVAVLSQRLPVRA